MLDVNLSGAFHMSRGALRHMLDRGTGRIINISSIAGETGNVGQANDAASKAGLIGLTKTLARKSGFLVAKAGKLTDDSVAIYRERGDTRPGRHRDARPHPSEGSTGSSPRSPAGA
jgi:3-oxoacyl-[acyl-carrier protein] reductase